MSSHTENRIYRIDRFQVPEDARSAFMARVHATHSILREQPGFIEDSVLEQQTGTSGFSLVTMVVWQDEASAGRAVAAVRSAHLASGFDRKAFLSETGIAADIGTYVRRGLAGGV